MSSTVGCRILAKLGRSRLSGLPSRIIGAGRFNSTAENAEFSKDIVPAPQPGKIQAALLKDFSSPLIIENLEPPKRAQENEVLIDVHYCALSASDLLLSQNLHTFEPKLPMILGYEVVGKLIEVGTEAEKNGYKIGDKVIALNKERYGGLAEKCLAEVGDIWKVPSTKSASSADLASILDSYITALVALERKVSLNEDDMILINVGVSGIGLAAVDLATNVFKAKVIGVCATEDCADRAREMGAFTALKYKDKKLMKQIKEIAAERDIKTIFEDEDGAHFKKLLSCFTDIYKVATLKDMLRNDSFAVVVHHLSREGRVIIAGTATTMADVSDVQKGSFSVTGFNLMEYKKKKPDVYRQAGDDVLQFLEEGLIAPSYSLIAGMHKVNDVLGSISENMFPGKVIIDMRDKEAAITKMVT
ncbi:PREDICTED: quinone oxidoreductase-like protein 2 isoform X1 [Trachymyrmex cornetzi]|uniref:Quinone oxidoreductase-like protein 2 n=1 Tax=Trachymyrmex cornetzi TaxID=471704 RepID=A0A195DCU2_9HYME|nr:PREDICTED: quinone oxidoreductase-like protein 2 isoform X1 [Trachymyrmex cornetzi]KYN10701.1 Quinone oxidoreductase-like protein 2 [Trachymyrmex cornetzi]